MGREDEFSEYVAAHWSRLVRTAVLLGCSLPEAEDVAQSALTRCLVHWSKVRRADSRDAYVHRIRILTDRVGVPGWRALSFDEQGNGAEAYLALLAELGLEADVVEESHPGMPPGFVMGISPAAGTMLGPGSTVAITLFAENGTERERIGEVRVTVVAGS